jgi:nucleotide-binding universal stress UspA family protein
MKIAKILVPVDFSEFSEKAVAYALYLAEKYAAHITLVHAMVLHYEEIEEAQHFKEYEKLVEFQENRTLQQFQKHNQQAGSQGVSIDSKILRGISAADALLEFINDSDYDLVVMGTHGRTGIKKWLYGSVTEKVVQHSTVPVLTIHSAWDKLTIERILVPVDFSDYSKKAVESALEFAKQFNARLVFLHVIAQEVHPAYYATSYDSLFVIDPQLQARSIKNLKEFTGGEIKNAEYVTREGRAYKEIVDYAKENECDLILMATRGLTGLEHLLIGSNTERVVRLAHCPVLTLER